MLWRGPFDHQASTLERWSSERNSTFTPGDSGSILAVNPGLATAHMTVTWLGDTDIAVEPPIRLNVSTCAAWVVVVACVVVVVTWVVAAGVVVVVACDVDVVAWVVDVVPWLVGVVPWLVGVVAWVVADSGWVVVLGAEVSVSTSTIDVTTTTSSSPDGVIDRGEAAAVPGVWPEVASKTLAVGIGSPSSSSTIETPAHATDTAAPLPTSHRSANPADLIMFCIVKGASSCAGLANPKWTLKGTRDGVRSRSFAPWHRFLWSKTTIKSEDWQ